ncbi:MAG: GntR family transcriptional regulator [Atopobiaceae bacterium]|nr:GntR family transcriptional regulator [Atopobiaceae bacterium]
MSKYDELATTLRTAIENGGYEAGTRLPTIPELCEMYNVSNTTVKKAMDELERLGLVARRRGSGVYVKRTAELRKGPTDGPSASKQMTGFTNEHAGTGTRVTSEVHDFAIVHPSDAVADGLGIRPEEFVYRICRTRLTDGTPRNVEYTFMPLSVVPGLLEEHLHGSIYRYLQEDLGLKIGSAHRVLRAVLPTEDEREWLRIENNAPLFEVRQVGYLDDGTPFEYSTSRHTSEYEFFVVSTY